VLIAAIGPFQSQRILMGICLLAGMLMLLALMPDRQGVLSVREQPISARAGMSGGMIAVIVAAALIWAMPAPADGLLAFRRDLLKTNPVPPMLFVGEGINSTVAVAQFNESVRSLSVGGRPEASSTPHDMRVQRMLGHVPALLHPKPRSVLIVGFGAGVTAGSFTRYPEIERIVIC